MTAFDPKQSFRAQKKARNGATLPGHLPQVFVGGRRMTNTREYRAGQLKFFQYADPHRVVQGMTTFDP